MSLSGNEDDESHLSTWDPGSRYAMVELKLCYIAYLALVGEDSTRANRSIEDWREKEKRPPREDTYVVVHLNPTLRATGST